MDESTKILAVSYGNFSCRLEGFDDSVETMKAVVSYFHELAGHDRFMDMEPQAPDMETLARLTEEQVGAPVEVEGEGNNVSLRMASAQAEEAVEDTLEDDLELAEEELVAEADEAAADAGDIPVDEVKEDEDTSLDAEDEPADEEELAADDAELNEDTLDTIVLRSEDEDVDADADDIAADDDGEDDTDIAEESVAAKLQRIRAVVGKDDEAETAAEADDTYAEDLTEPDAPKVAGVNPLAQRLADLAKRNAERAAEEAGVELRLDDEDDDVTEEELAELEAEFDEEEVHATAAQTEDADEDAKDDVLQLAPEDLADDDEGPLVLTPDEEVASRGITSDFDLKEEVAEAQREIEEKEARSKHNDVLDAVDKNMTRIMTQTDERLNEVEGRRHRDAFAQLKAAVAATEAARQLGDAGAEARDKNEVFREDLGALGAEKSRDADAEPAVEDVDDVNNTTDQALEETGAQESDRNDTAEETETAAPAPLKLVSSQIVDPASSPLDAASARLREIAAQKDSGGAPKGGFAEFAAQQGATELADLLEAAAAYIAFVEGDDDFSRPQVMKKVQAASANEFTREDGLRSFGRLLRQSRIIKLNNGRFQVAEDTRFRPGDKAAQG